MVVMDTVESHDRIAKSRERCLLFEDVYYLVTNLPVSSKTIWMLYSHHDNSLVTMALSGPPSPTLIPPESYKKPF